MKKMGTFQIRKKERHLQTYLTMAEMGVQNCSSMSVRRFCHSHNLRRRGLVSDTHLELAVARSINQVGYAYYL